MPAVGSKGRPGWHAQLRLSCALGDKPSHCLGGLRREPRGPSPGPRAPAVQGHFPSLSEVMEAYLDGRLRIPQNLQTCFSLEISLASIVPAILQTKRAGLLGVGRHVQLCTPTAGRAVQPAEVLLPTRPELCPSWSAGALVLLKVIEDLNIFYEGHIC